MLKASSDLAYTSVGSESLVAAVPVPMKPPFQEVGSQLVAT